MNRLTSRSVFKMVIAVTFLMTANVYCQSVAPSTPASGKDEQTARTEFKRLRDLQAALKKIPGERSDKEPHKTFLKRNDKDIVYSEPSAEWYVRSERFWALHEKYKDLTISDEIAWTAAQNPLPGECEGYLNCYLFLIRSTDGEYLKLYPNGRYSKTALQRIVEGLASTVVDLGKNETHTGPAEASDKAELSKLLDEMRAIASNVSNPEKAKLLTQIKQIGDAYK